MLAGRQNSDVIMSEICLVHERNVRSVLGVEVDSISWPRAIGRILSWGDAYESRIVCLCNVHSLVTARNDPAHKNALRRADMVAPDGAPVAWMLRRLGAGKQERISGPDLMWRCCAEAARRRLSIYLYGSSPPVLLSLEQKLRAAFPNLNIAGAYSPPFRPLSAEEDALIVRRINDSGANLVWVGLGCPKQESWMQANCGRIHAVMIGVGAAFDFHSGRVKRAPGWMQRAGLEWLHRLSQDPLRLARRYLIGNAVFVVSAAIDLLKTQRHPNQTIG
jgi:N-acetylglucosaminyldiphosphoundecaprenol N-acetyl-beta-D-mannosaminyltransferase